MWLSSHPFIQYLLMTDFTKPFAVFLNKYSRFLIFIKSWSAEWRVCMCVCVRWYVFISRWFVVLLHWSLCCVMLMKLSTGSVVFMMLFLFDQPCLASCFQTMCSYLATRLRFSQTQTHNTHIYTYISDSLFNTLTRS